MAELELRHVYKDYQMGNKSKFAALSDINITFEKGELVSVVGESGSGKSTLMNLIGGLDSDYRGEIISGGEKLSALKDKERDEYRKKKVGFVFQSFNLIPHLSILDNVTIALTLSNVKTEEKVEKAKAILTRLGLEKQIKKKPNQLSGGQKQRVAIARALINDPEIILADEPTGALDSTTTLQILDILKEIADEGKLVIMVTHSEKVASISSRIVEISDGMIIRDEYNLSYKKAQPQALQGDVKIKKKKKSNLSFFQAIRLSFHNMWASKTKNSLMAFGVSISLIALIIMLSFGTGLTEYIDNLANSYSSPKIVTITKSGLDKDGNKLPSDSTMSGLLSPLTFEQEQIRQIADDINVYLEEQSSEFRVDTTSNLSYGYNALTNFLPKSSVSYKVDENTVKGGKIFYLYTTPTYYNETNLICGEFSGINEVMFSKAIVQTLGFKDENDAIGKTVSIDVEIDNIIVKEELVITGIVDVSMFANLTVMYIDYDFLDSLVRKSTTGASGLKPSSIYIQTDSKNTTDMINAYIKTRKDLSGSVEQQMAKMFSEMMSTFSTALAIIAAISLTVAAIMILTVLYMSVTERTREIGVLKSIGARKKDIKMIFSSESLLIGLWSGLLGIILSLIIGGILVLVLNSVLGFAPLAFKWYYYLIALGLSVVISVVAGLYPAAKAARLDPVDSLRHE